MVTERGELYVIFAEDLIGFLYEWLSKVYSFALPSSQI